MLFKNDCFYNATMAIHNKGKKIVLMNLREKARCATKEIKKSVTNLTDKQKFEGTRFFIVRCKQTFFFLQSAKNLIVYERKCSLYVILCWCTCFLSIRK